MYQIEYQNKDIIIRFDGKSVDKNLIASMLEYFEIEQIRRKSKLTARQAELLAKEINRKVWDKLKEKVLED